MKTVVRIDSLSREASTLATKMLIDLGRMEFDPEPAPPPAFKITGPGKYTDRNGMIWEVLGQRGIWWVGFRLAGHIRLTASWSSEGWQVHSEEISRQDLISYLGPLPEGEA